MNSSREKRKTLEEILKHTRERRAEICCFGHRIKAGREGRRISQYRGDDGGYQGKEEEARVKKGKRGDGEPMNAQIHLFSASLYLAAHTFSLLQQPVFTAINLGVAFWPASPA